MGKDQWNAIREMAMYEYKYTLQIFDRAMKALDTMPKSSRRQVGYAMDVMQRTFSGDIKKLKGYENRYRLRVGNFRVMFIPSKTIFKFTTYGIEKTLMPTKNISRPAKTNRRRLAQIT